MAKFQKGHKGYWLGKKRPLASEETRRKMSIAHKGRRKSEKTKLKMSKGSKGKNKGKNNGMWRGEKAGYVAKHLWISKHLGKADHCEECKLDKIPEGMKTYFEWANISQKYKRDIKDWKQLCKKCHAKLDKNCGRGRPKNIYLKTKH